MLLREGHWPARRTVLIPRSAVAEVTTDGFHLGITRQEVQHLPPAGISQRGGQHPKLTALTERAELGLP